MVLGTQPVKLLIRKIIKLRILQYLNGFVRRLLTEKGWQRPDKLMVDSEVIGNVRSFVSVKYPGQSVAQIIKVLRHLAYANQQLALANGARLNDRFNRCLRLRTKRMRMLQYRDNRTHLTKLIKVGRHPEFKGVPR